MLTVSKRFHYFLQREAALQGVVLRIILSVVERCLNDRDGVWPGLNDRNKEAF